MKRNRTLIQFTMGMIAVALFFISFGQPIEAAVASRAALVNEVIGNVWVTKGGGNAKLRAYPGMRLTQGDQLTTETYASVNVTISDTNDVLTIGKNAKVRFTELQLAKNDRISRVTVLAGTVLSSVNPERRPGDVFEVNTPNQKNQAVGTVFIVNVDPITQHSYVGVLSGTVGSLNGRNPADSPGFIYPTQQAHQYPDEQTTGENAIGMDLQTFVQAQTPHLLEEILKNKHKIDAENRSFIDRAKQSLEDQEASPFPAQEDLSRFEQNAQHLTEQILQQAIRSNQLNDEAAQSMLQRVNESSVTKISLSNLPIWQQSKEEIERQQMLEQSRLQRIEEIRRQQEALRNKNNQLVQEMQRQRAQQEEQLKKQHEEAKRRAEERLVSQLDAMERAAFEKAKLERAAEQQRQEQAAKKEEQMSKPLPVYSPMPSVPSEIDQSLALAKRSIPTDRSAYTEESWTAVEEALQLPERTDDEKSMKIGAIHEAIVNLISLAEKALTEINNFDLEQIDSDTPEEAALLLLATYAQEIGIDIRTVDGGCEHMDSFAAEVASLVFGERPVEGFASLVEVKELIEQMVQELGNHCYSDTPAEKEVTFQTSDTSITLSWDNTESYKDIRIFVDDENVWDEEEIELSETMAIIKNVKGGQVYKIVVEFRHVGFDFPNAVSNELFIEL